MDAIYGFIGRNGAGKSTTQKMVCGLINLLHKVKGNIMKKTLFSSFQEQATAYRLT